MSDDSIKKLDKQIELLKRGMDGKTKVEKVTSEIVDSLDENHVINISYLGCEVKETTKEIKNINKINEVKEEINEVKEEINEVKEEIKEEKNESSNTGKFKLVDDLNEVSEEDTKEIVIKKIKNNDKNLFIMIGVTIFILIFILILLLLL